MKKTNLQIFEELDLNQFFCSFERAAQHFRSIRFYPDALGFDVDSGGYLALHRLHNDHALSQEIPACLILKKLGFRVCLQEESGFVQSADAQLNDWVFEIKRISKTSRIEKAVVFQFRTSYWKADRILLHIDQDVNLERCVLPFSMPRKLTRTSVASG